MKRDAAVDATFDVVARWRREGRADLPLPGAGDTWTRWRELMDLARADLPAARVIEAHADALAILAELERPGVQRRPGEQSQSEGDAVLWAVWAAEPPAPRVTASRDDHGDGWRLDGTKAWCSAASFATHALVTADVGSGETATPRLFRVDLRQPGVSPEALDWASAGMASTDTARVAFDGVPAKTVGDPAGYLQRAGFWHGGIGVACCWWGGAQGLIDLLASRVRRRASAAAETHLGACLAWDAVITGALRSAAADVDAAPADFASARRRALAIRTLVDRACTDVIERFGRALGAAPFAADRSAAQLVADLQVYTRQSHAETDEAALARFALAEGVTTWSERT